MTRVCGDEAGTAAGYARHLRAKDIACRPCLAAERRRKETRKANLRRSKCGTEAGWLRHRRRGEKCPRCRAAATEADKRRRRAKTAANPPGPREPIIYVPRAAFAHLYTSTSIANQLLVERHIKPRRLQLALNELDNPTAPSGQTLMQVPRIVLAKLYLEAPPPDQQRVEACLDPHRLQRCVEELDLAAL
ncbi:hypothetical protein IU485_27695 [Nocardia cyriacigeorgica]|uniref:hypothetical protein n=1 Tax=Nocardia cyriacigeorgica TaxID=135487 RepID=UPI0018936A29|nr:hypothetical protein [Nocardia cyriacigeorgica]MBF6085161.1 hypothetical protein [Nocardia cyriacigeorgica]